MRGLALFGVLTALLASAAPALANGRFPRAERLLEDATNPRHLVLAATYGLLVSEDRGRSWHHVCEAAFAQTDLQTDPLVALTPDGALLAGIYASIARSSDGACSFENTLGSSNFESVPDFTLVAGVPGRVLAILVTLQPSESGAGETTERLYRSDDAGKSFAPLGSELPDSLGYALTLEVAPADPNRVYVSGLGPDGEGVLLRSDDGGLNFESLKLPTDAALGEAPYIAAVDAKDPDAVYVRTDLWAYDEGEGVAHAHDALLYSADGGRTFTELLRKGGKLLGFTFSPSGDEVLVGYGDPLEGGGGRLTDAASLGIYRAPRASSDFERRYGGSVGCLTWSERGLYACTNENETGFSLGFAQETDFHEADASVFESALRLGDVKGPVECGAANVCLAYWESTCESWGRTDCATVAPTTDATPAAVTASGGCRTAAGSTTSHALALVAAVYGLRKLRVKARPRAGSLRSGGSPSCRTRTARAPGAPPRCAPT